jgi:hypothetical protein
MANPIGQTTSFTLNAGTPTALAPANPQRRVVIIINNDPTNKVYVSFGRNGVAATTDIPIPAGFMFEEQGDVPIGDIAAIAAAGTPQISLTED